MANEAKRFYKGSGIAKHREWRGLKDTFYDYAQWAVNLGILAKFVTKSPVRIVKGLLEYRWFGAYMGTLHMIDRSMAGMRGPALRVLEIREACNDLGAHGLLKHDELVCKFRVAEAAVALHAVGDHLRCAFHDGVHLRV
mgnify:CR=1 FL=1